MSTRPFPDCHVPDALCQPLGPENALLDDPFPLERTATSNVPAVLAEVRVGEIELPLPVASVPVCLREMAALAGAVPTVSARANRGTTARAKRSVSGPAIGGERRRGQRVR